MVKFKKAVKKNCCGRRRCCLANKKKRFYCKPCKRLRAKLCRGYHGRAGAVSELLGRLTYEFVFDIVPEAALFEGWWLKAGLRDRGHHFRMKKLWMKCQGRIGWLRSRL